MLQNHAAAKANFLPDTAGDVSGTMTSADGHKHGFRIGNRPDTDFRHLEDRDGAGLTLVIQVSSAAEGLELLRKAMA